MRVTPPASARRRPLHNPPPTTTPPPHVTSVSTSAAHPFPLRCRRCILNIYIQNAPSLMNSARYGQSGPIQCFRCVCVCVCVCVRVCAHVCACLCCMRVRLSVGARATGNSGAYSSLLIPCEGYSLIIENNKAGFFFFFCLVYRPSLCDHTSQPTQLEIGLDAAQSNSESIYIHSLQRWRSSGPDTVGPLTTGPVHVYHMYRHTLPALPVSLLCAGCGLCSVTQYIVQT